MGKLQWPACLALNLKKTKYIMIFTRKRTYAEQSIIINNVLIERKSTGKFLGVIIDENMTWAHHISTIETKMAS